MVLPIGQKSFALITNVFPSQRSKFTQYYNLHFNIFNLKNTKRFFSLLTESTNYNPDPEAEVLWEWDRMQGGAASKPPKGEKAPLRNKNTNAGKDDNVISNCCCWCLVILTILTACLLFICLFLLHHIK